MSIGKTLVTGAAGNTGRRLVASLLHRGADVRAFVRRNESCNVLAAMGVCDCIAGTLEDDRALAAALEGVAQVLHVCPPMHREEDAIARRLTGLCARAGVARLILWSVLHPEIDVPHHRRKLAAQTHLIDSGLTYTILQPARYMQHLVPIWEQVLRQGEHSMPFATTARFSLADLADLAEAAAIVATQPGHEFATYQLAGPTALSQEDCAEILGGLLGKPVTARERDLAAFCEQAASAGMPAWRIDNMATMNRHYTAHGLVGNPNVLTWLLGRRPNSFADFVRRELLNSTQ